MKFSFFFSLTSKMGRNHSVNDFESLNCSQILFDNFDLRLRVGTASGSLGYSTEVFSCASDLLNNDDDGH